MVYTGYSAVSDVLGQVTFDLPAGNYWFGYQKEEIVVTAGEAGICTLPGCSSFTLSTAQGTA